MQVLCPFEKVFKVQNGKKVLREKISYPGYIMIEATDKLNDTDDTDHYFGNGRDSLPG